MRQRIEERRRREEEAEGAVGEATGQVEPFTWQEMNISFLVASGTCGALLKSQTNLTFFGNGRRPCLASYLWPSSERVGLHKKTRFNFKPRSL